MAAPNVLVLMGVAGCGKSTVGRMLAERLGWCFLDGDDLHPAANIIKMRAGTPLDDADRLPWLAVVAARIDAWRFEETRGVVACSALRRAYRDIIIGARSDVGIVHLRGACELIAARLAVRKGHFMPTGLLDSQFLSLEPPDPDENAITIDIDASPATVAGRIVTALAGW